MGKQSQIGKKPKPSQTGTKPKSSLSKQKTRQPRNNNVKNLGQLPTGHTVAGHPNPQQTTASYPNATSTTKSSFMVRGIAFSEPNRTNSQFDPRSAEAATASLPAAEIDRTTGGRAANSGVRVGDIGSYGVIQRLEKVGDGLTGDHQPSGAAVKEAIREKLHLALQVALTRSKARNAYKRAITIVMTDAWHRAESRTYGGRNTPAQIKQDAANFAEAVKADWAKTVPGLKAEGLSDHQIQAIWSELEIARTNFFNAHKPTAAFKQI